VAGVLDIRATGGAVHPVEYAAGRRNAASVAAMRSEPHHQRMSESPESVDLRIWKADAVVLFDWLMTVDMDAVPVSHPAEKQALLDLLNRLEQTAVAKVSQAAIDIARGEVSKNVGW
jgi:hypothetical protein